MKKVALLLIFCFALVAAAVPVVTAPPTSTIAGPTTAHVTATALASAPCLALAGGIPAVATTLATSGIAATTTSEVTAPVAASSACWCVYYKGVCLFCIPFGCNPECWI